MAGGHRSGKSWARQELEYIDRLKAEAKDEIAIADVYPSRKIPFPDVSRETSTRHFLYNGERKRSLRLLLT